MLGLNGCIEDGFTASPSDQPVFSTDTLNMGMIFTEQPSTTHRFTVINPASKALNISKISLSGDNAGLFRLNVDGFSGREFSDVEIRAKDSIYVFVETTLPANNRNVPVEVEAHLDFLTNGVTNSVVLTAQGRDVKRLRALEIAEDTRLTADIAYQIFDSLVVKPGATLTVDPGVEMFFHDAAQMVVHGTLKAIGAQGNEIVMQGDRTGNVAADISFDLMSRQWDGLWFTSTSRDNELSYTHLCNTSYGVAVDGSEATEPVELTMINSRLRNSGDFGLRMIHANLRAYGCEIAEAAYGALMLYGGEHTVNQCTLSNYYLFAAIGSPILTLGWTKNGDDYFEATDADLGKPFTKAEICNTIIYGLGKDISHGDLTDTDVYLRRCLLKSEGTDDANFLECVWGQDPLFRTVREDYYFDYRLQEGSPAIAAADATLVAPQSATDRLGNQRGQEPDLGAYVYTVEVQ